VFFVREAMARPGHKLIQPRAYRSRLKAWRPERTLAETTQDGMADELSLWSDVLSGALTTSRYMDSLSTRCCGSERAKIYKTHLKRRPSASNRVPPAVIWTNKEGPAGAA
jgi:hypothetical protein